MSTMAKIHILPSEFKNKLEMQMAYSIKAGFSSPADDYQHDTLDFNRDLIKHPEATFYGKVDGDSMVEAGILDGDIAIIDRSADPNDGDVIVAFVNNEFTIKFLDLSHKAVGAQQYPQKNDQGKSEVFANAIKHDFRSKNPTTRWSDIIRLK